MKNYKLGLLSIVSCALLLASCDEGNTEKEPIAATTHDKIKCEGDVSFEIAGVKMRVDRQHARFRLDDGRSITDPFQPIKDNPIYNCEIDDVGDVRYFRILRLELYSKHENVPTKYKSFKSYIDDSRKLGNSYELPSGSEIIDYGGTIGILLPQDKSPTFNNEPVFINCSKRLESCETSYWVKNNLKISYNFIESGIDENKFIEKDLMYRTLIQEMTQQQNDYDDFRGNEE